MLSPGLRKKLAAAAAIAAVILAFHAAGLEQYFTLAYLKTSHARIAALYAARPGLVISTYAALYVLMAALSLPGAAVMTLAAGALFGVPAGTIVVSFASSAGAVLACGFSRYVLREWVSQRWAGALKAVNEGIAKEGAFYLFTLRMIPVFPFWLINLVMGVTGMRLFTFYWVSQAGMLAGTVVYVNAGRELARVDSVQGIFSPRLLVSLALLGIFPLVVRRLVGLRRRDKGMQG